MGVPNRLADQWRHRLNRMKQLHDTPKKRAGARCTIRFLMFSSATLSAFAIRMPTVDPGQQPSVTCLQTPVPVHRTLFNPSISCSTA